MYMTLELYSMILLAFFPMHKILNTKKIFIPRWETIFGQAKRRTKLGIFLYLARNVSGFQAVIIWRQQVLEVGMLMNNCATAK